MCVLSAYNNANLDPRGACGIVAALTILENRVDKTKGAVRARKMHRDHIGVRNYEYISYSA